METIKFELLFKPIFWDKPPHAKILLDNKEYFNDYITDTTLVSFHETLAFEDHLLEILRSNKTDDQSVDENKDQKLLLKEVKIDGINIRNIVWHYSYYVPEYPKLWSLYQKKQGVELEKYVPGETIFAHNGGWNLKFSSPFYQYIFKWMHGEIIND